MQTNVRVPHFAFDLRFRHQCRNGVDDDNVDRAAAHERFGDLQRLFPRIRLGQQKFVDVHAQLAGIRRVQCMLGVDEGSLSADLLNFSDRVQRYRRFTGRFRPIDFDNPSARKSSGTQGDIQGDRSARDDLYLHMR
ncbi:hypothetical protein D3C81_1440360 [compost metagenome]